jgi:hypothetical protein
VGTLDSGEIDYDELKQQLAANAARPAIINVNIGTTVKGAVDDLDRILDILKVGAPGRGAGGLLEKLHCSSSTGSGTGSSGSSGSGINLPSITKLASPHPPTPPCLLSAPPGATLAVLCLLQETGYPEERFFIHCDGALFGMMVSAGGCGGVRWGGSASRHRPHCLAGWLSGLAARLAGLQAVMLELGGLRAASPGCISVYRRLAVCSYAAPNHLVPPCTASYRLVLQIPFVKRAPMVTFKKPIGSISVSGHKFVGSPVPCGVVMTRLK